MVCEVAVPIAVSRSRRIWAAMFSAAPLSCWVEEYLENRGIPNARTRPMTMITTPNSIRLNPREDERSMRGTSKGVAAHVPARNAPRVGGRLPLLIGREARELE